MLGEMAELGHIATREHRTLGELVSVADVRWLVAVGDDNANELAQKPTGLKPI
ncbi:hypothetical protein OHA72_48050 [Dactylosporangium sp. NBC_01737]|uniref:hypothetical protein n=1 Tax=Dactylosporangium sp. NBC_01737 TaxID=2975959 RepID=UPI002E152142|nr:hypothetical protein OHA72_48050 [Dactylosporangium sp. NBC_01737]